MHRTDGHGSTRTCSNTSIDDDGGGSGKSKQKIIQLFFHTNHPCQHERVIELAEVNCRYRFKVSKTHGKVEMCSREKRVLRLLAQANRSDEAHTTICQFCHSNANSLRFSFRLFRCPLLCRRSESFSPTLAQSNAIIFTLLSLSFDSHCRCTLRIPTCNAMHFFSAKKV